MSTYYSIVISTLPGNDDYLFQCLNSIKKNTVGSYEIILVVCGSNPFAEKLADIFGTKIIKLDDPVHFSKAYNIGLSKASGEYLIILNDDTLVSKNWNVKLMTCLESFSKKTGAPEAAIVGPVSNNVGGSQMIPHQIASRITPMNYEDAANQVEKENKETWVASSFISGFCMMVKRFFYELNKPEFFDERLVNGAEDNLISLKAMFQGYTNVISGDTFIYHYGSKTMDKVCPESGRGVKNLFEYYQIANEEIVPRHKKIASACRVRLINDSHVQQFLKGVEQQAELSDVLLFVNDRSNIWPEKEIKDICNKFNKPYYVEKYNKDHDEIRDRQRLLQMANEQNCNWYLSWDADELFENKFNRSYIERLTSPPRPDILNYLFHWYTFWDSDGKSWRVDSTFGNMHGARLARILPNYNMFNPKSGLHMGNIPTLHVLNAGRITSVRIKHYGYGTEEERQRKYEFYEKTDKIKNPTEIGNKDYSHLIASSYQLAPWIEDSDLTIGTIVRNEEIRLHGFLDRLWAFADKMIFCDTGSTDRTIDLLKYFGAKVISYEKETGSKWDYELPDLSEARNLILPHVETKWFWHHDIDEELLSKSLNGLSTVRRMMDKTRIDAYQFMFRNISTKGVHTLSQATRLIKNPKEWFYTGYTHETMDEASRNKVVALSPVQVVHSGWLIDDEKAKQKLKIYLRGNLRMIQDYPDDPRGWFNAALHMFDIKAINTAMKFIEQALARNPTFAAARKELIVQGAQQLFKQADALKSCAPKGHPFYTFAEEVQDKMEDIKADNEMLVRVPEHVIEVLSEPEFSTIKEMVRKFDNINLGEIKNSKESITKQNKINNNESSIVLVDK